MVNLISRSGTLFSIIDGKEIVCKDQELAKKLIAPFKPDLNGEWSYSVPGYTVRLEGDCDKYEGHMHTFPECWKAILSLEAPEKEAEQPAQPVDKEKNNLFELNKFCRAQLKIIRDKQEGSDNHTERLCLAFAGNILIDVIDEIVGMIESVSPSPERGESDGCCQCKPDETTGWTDFKCNICGKKINEKK